jgi:hypothetical protein
VTGPAIAEWANFFSAEAESAATLTGLVIVAVSINLARIIETRGLPGRAVETLSMLFSIVLAGTFGLVPGQSAPVLGGELLGTGAALWLAIVTIEARAGRSPGEPRWSKPVRVAIGQLASLPTAVAGATLIAGTGGGLYWLLPGVICCLVGSMFNAWVLLVEIMR